MTPTSTRARIDWREVARLTRLEPPTFVVTMPGCGCVVAANEQSVTDRIAELVLGATSRIAVGREATADRKRCGCYTRQGEVTAAARTAMNEWYERLHAAEAAGA